MNNRQKRLTGMLIFKKGVFLELLEGEREQIFEAYKRIMHDERHSEVVMLELEPIEERSFTGFKMCFDSQFEKTHHHTGHYMNCTDAERLLARIEKPTKGVIELLTMVC